MLRFDKLTLKAQEAVQASRETAARHEQQQIDRYIAWCRIRWRWASWRARPCLATMWWLTQARAPGN